jgi:hypothetical protein
LTRREGILPGNLLITVEKIPALGVGPDEWPLDIGKSNISYVNIMEQAGKVVIDFLKNIYSDYPVSYS